METKIRKPQIVLTIAGSDPSGGAGIQADLKAFASVGVYGTSVITCITAQNTTGVQLLEPISTNMILAQLDSVLNDLKPMVIKTGMLYSPEIIAIVGKRLDEYRKSINDLNNDELKLIVDPVLSSTTGQKLTGSNNDLQAIIDTYKKSLFTNATVITPNIPEAEQILGRTITTFDEMVDACKDLIQFGPENVILKGGHAGKEFEKDDLKNSKDVIDLLYNGKLFEYRMHRIDKDVHGTGCTFASLLAGYIAKGFEVPKAVKLVKQIITNGINDSINVGSGIGIVNISSKLGAGLGVENDIEYYPIIVQIIQAADELTQILDPYFVPEVGINIGFAKKSAKSLQDVCALTGRLIRVGNRIEYLGRAQFGASKHVARIIFSVMNTNNEIRSAMNIKYRPEIIQECKKLRFTIGSFDRTDEPEESSSMEWGTNIAIKNLGKVPDVIFDTGGVGKEPMIRILGNNPKNVVAKVEKIVNSMKTKK